jgi:hypothetical protein
LRGYQRDPAHLVAPLRALLPSSHACISTDGEIFFDGCTTPMTCSRSFQEPACRFANQNRPRRSSGSLLRVRCSAKLEPVN